MGETLYLLPCDYSLGLPHHRGSETFLEIGNYDGISDESPRNGGVSGCMGPISGLRCPGFGRISHVRMSIDREGLARENPRM